MSRRRRAAAAGLAAAASIGAAMVARTLRRWADTPDLSGGALLLPDGEQRVLERPDGVRLALTDTGTGAPVFVLAHCWTGDQRVWGPVARRLVKAGARVVLYDHRGHGQSSTDCEHYSLAALGDDLAAVIESLDSERVVLAGHSMGGMAIQAFLSRHPELAQRRVAGIGFVATATDGQRPRSAIERRLTPWLMQSSLGDRAFASPLAPLFARFTVGQTVSTPQLQAVIQPFMSTPPAVRRTFIEAIYAMDFTDVLRATTIPVVLLSGTHDQLTTPSTMKRMADAMPHAKLVTLPGAGHMLPQEEPDQVTAALLELAGAAPTQGEQLS